MNSKTILKIVVSTLPTVCLIAHNVSNSHAGKLLREIQSEQNRDLEFSNTMCLNWLKAFCTHFSNCSKKC